MWLIEDPPTLRKAMNDAVKTVAHCRALDAADQAKLLKLYKEYDSKKGRIDAADLVPLDRKKVDIKKQYPKTYGKGILSNIRKDLMKDIERCPMCSLLPVTDLDHFWNQNSYGQLAVCRLNLIPTCGTCNVYKSDSSSNLFIHAYYEQIPSGVVFLNANCKIVNGYVIPAFSINGTGLCNPILTQRLIEQIVQVHLKNRLRAASKEYMRKLLQGTTFTSDAALKSFLKKEESEKTRDYGLNDWRTALIRGLRACRGFDMTVVMNYRRSTKRTRDAMV